MTRIKGDNLTNPPRRISWREYRAAFGDTARDSNELGIADVRLTNYEACRFDRLEAQRLAAEAVAEAEVLRKKLKKIKRVIRGPKIQTEKKPRLRGFYCGAYHRVTCSLCPRCLGLQLLQFGS